MNNAQKLGLAVLLVLYALLPQFLKSYGIYLMTLLCVYLMAGREAPEGSGLQPGDLVVGIVRRPDPVPCPACAVGARGRG